MAIPFFREFDLRCGSGSAARPFLKIQELRTNAAGRFPVLKLGWALGLCAALLALQPPPVSAAAPPPGRLTVQVNHPGPAISPTLYGLMTEEINHAYDGGLYAELIRNRSFQDDPAEPAGWTLVNSGGGAATIALDDTQPVPGTALTTCLRLEITAAGAGQSAGVANSGYWGIPLRPHTRYRASFYAKSGNGFAGPLTLSLQSDDGSATFATARVSGISNGWKRYQTTLRTGAVTPSSTNRLVITAAHPGTVWLNLVSLFPPTFNNTPNGNRIELMQKLQAMHPAFLRFPGGNYLEGNTIAERFDWKKTIGPLADRPGHQSPWGYHSTDGMGLLEFLEWCQDLRMQPLLAVYAGYSLRGEHVEPGPALAPFVQDALDEIEYVTGDVTSRWGAERARDGHPAPFPLTYVEIGNEDEFDRSGSYDGRFTQFYDAIKAHYPALQVIATATVRSRTPDVRDDHYYRSAVAMERDVHHYDAASRTGPKVFVGEWATTEGRPTPTFDAALGDAAWLTGLERNSDLVVMASYAPLLVNVNPGASQWPTNLIGYDALTSFGSPSYYMQALFSQNRGDVVLPVDITAQTTPPQAPELPHGAIGVGTWSTQAEFKDIDVTRGDETLFHSDFTTGTPGNRPPGWRLARGQWSVQDGALRQTGDTTGALALTGNPTWGDYTYHLQARKLSGDEGFLVLFHTRGPGNLIWWNIGGWGNTQDGLEKTAEGGKFMLGTPVPDHIETGRWYDIRIELQGEQIRCYLDNKLVQEATDIPPAPPAPLFATASGDRQSGDVILKVVNVSTAPQQLSVDLQGVRNAGGTAHGWVMTGDPEAQNSIDAPDQIVPQAVTVPATGATFVHEFPAHSITVLRVRTGSRF